MKYITGHVRVGTSVRWAEVRTQRAIPNDVTLRALPLLMPGGIPDSHTTLLRSNAYVTSSPVCFVWVQP